MTGSAVGGRRAFLGLCLSALPLLACRPAAAGGPKGRLWQAEGFANPESVVWDEQAKLLYVSNVNGNPVDKDGNGFIAKLSPDGRVVDRTWVTGLDGPKGMAVRDGRLYVADIDRLVVIDTASGRLIKSYAADGAKFLDDVAIDGKGAVYVSDTLGDCIWRLSAGHFERWLADPALHTPTGLLAERDRLVVATWGGRGDRKGGALLAVDYGDPKPRPLAAGLGQIDGVDTDGAGNYLVSEPAKGVVLRVFRSGRAKTIITLSPGSADIGIIPGRHVLLVPNMEGGTVSAWRLKP